MYVIGKMIRRVERLGETREAFHPGVRTKQYLLTSSSYDEDEMLAPPGESFPDDGRGVLPVLAVITGCLVATGALSSSTCLTIGLDVLATEAVGCTWDFMYRPPDLWDARPLTTLAA